jgi:hypothetical protein
MTSRKNTLVKGKHGEPSFGAMSKQDICSQSNNEKKEILGRLSDANKANSGSHNGVNLSSAQNSINHSLKNP